MKDGESSVNLNKSKFIVFASVLFTLWTMYTKQQTSGSILILLDDL